MDQPNTPYGDMFQLHLLARAAVYQARVTDTTPMPRPAQISHAKALAAALTMQQHVEEIINTISGPTTPPEVQP